ncbi:MAG: Hsp20/alpha crystallin family protein [Planctomycetota bacterium]
MNTQIACRPFGRPSIRGVARPGRTGRVYGVGAPVHLDRLFDELLGFDPFAPRAHRAVAPTDVERALAVDVSETDAELIVRASLPGFTPEQVEAEVHDDVLTIRAQRELTEVVDPGAEDSEHSTETEGSDDHTSAEPAERWLRRERRLGALSRQIALPVAVDDSAAVATLVNGELELRLPKVQDPKPRRIQVN